MILYSCKDKMKHVVDWNYKKFLLTLLIVVLIALFVSIFLLFKLIDFNDHTIAIVSTECGPVKGYLKWSMFDGIAYYAFKGIPYAKPPVGDLRFRVKQLILKIMY